MLAPHTQGSQHPELLASQTQWGGGPQQILLPLLMLGGTFLGQGIHPAPLLAGAEGPSPPRCRWESLQCFRRAAPGRKSGGERGGGPARSNPPFPDTMSPGGRDTSCGVGKASLPTSPSGHAPGPGGSQCV